MLLTRSATMVAGLLLATACADDPSSTSGVAGTKKIAALSQDELIQLCNWVQAQEFMLSVRSECEGGAVFKTLTQAECEAKRDTCIAEAPAKRMEQMEMRLASCAATRVTLREDCTATVAQLEDCANDTMANNRSFYGALSCAMVNPDIDDHVPEARSCALVGDYCWP